MLMTVCVTPVSRNELHGVDIRENLVPLAFSGVRCSCLASRTKHQTTFAGFRLVVKIPLHLSDCMFSSRTLVF